MKGKEIIHFAHGNGFPSPCYMQLLSRLQTRFDICYIDRIGHDFRFPVQDNWEHLIDEVILSIKTQSTQPIIAVGHSLGGVLSVLAAIKQPELFRAVVLLDSPLIGRVKSSIVRLSKWVGMIDFLTPASRTRGRREHWHTREEVFEYLKHRELFKHFTDACLNDYINFGLQYDELGFSLRFNPETEYKIYRTLPHVLYRYEQKLKVPTGLIYGSNSSVMTRAELKYMQKYYGIVAVKTAGSHMFPMEHPDVAAQLVMDLIDELL